MSPGHPWGTQPGRGRLGAIRQLSQDQVYRVANASWGPLNPPLRPSTVLDVDTSWGRFDVPGVRTVYAGATPGVSLAEMLAPLRLPVGKTSGLEKDAAFLELSTEEFAELVENEWKALGHPPPGHVARSWRATRLMHRLTLPTQGWWVKLDEMNTLGFLENALSNLLQPRGIETLTISHLTGEDRSLTVNAAAILYQSRAREDGTRPSGIVFPSKHGAGYSYACWMRPARQDEGTDDSMNADSGRVIAKDDPDLLEVARRFRLRIH